MGIVASRGHVGLFVHVDIFVLGVLRSRGGFSQAENGTAINSLRPNFLQDKIRQYGFQK